MVNADKRVWNFMCARTLLSLLVETCCTIIESVRSKETLGPKNTGGIFCGANDFNGHSPHYVMPLPPVRYALPPSTLCPHPVRYMGGRRVFDLI